MASPNFSEYVNLTISDLDVVTIYDDSVEYAQTNLPEFNPRIGTIENAILEATAYQTNNIVTAINRLPDGLMEGLLSLMGFNRIEATQASGTVTIELVINTGATILAGTVFSYDVYDAEGVLTQYLFETDEDLTIASGSTTGTVSVVASEASQYPDIPTLSSLTVVSSTPFILGVTLTTLSTAGQDTETDNEYFNRATTYLSSLSSAITTASQMTGYIAVNYPTVSKFKVYDLTEVLENYVTNAVLATNVVTLTTANAHGYAIGDSVTVRDMANAVYNGTYTVTGTPTTTTFTYARTNTNISTAAVTAGSVVLATGMLFSTADSAGNVTISMCDSAGDPISDEQKSIIKADLSSRVVAGLNINLHDTNTFNVDVAVSIVVEPNYSTSVVGTAVSNAIEAYLSIAGWDWAESVDARYLTTIASKVTGVKYVDSVDATLNGATVFASNDSLNVAILEKGAIPIGNCTTTAV
jgi:hypothetical protein